MNTFSVAVVDGSGHRVERTVSFLTVAAERPRPPGPRRPGRPPILADLPQDVRALLAASGAPQVSRPAALTEAESAPADRAATLLSAALEVDRSGRAGAVPDTGDAGARPDGDQDPVRLLRKLNRAVAAGRLRPPNPPVPEV